MTPHDALADGRLSDAVDLQEAAVRDRPGDPAARLLLFELLAVAGRLDEARTHLRAVESPDPNWPSVRRGFLRTLKAERSRRRGRRPGFPDDPPAHARRRWHALTAFRDDRPDAAAEWVDRADAVSPHVTGHVDGREFDGLRDTDDRFGSVLEAFVGSEYVWFPFEGVRKIVLFPAGGVLDAVFRPAAIRLLDGRELAVVLPLVYPESAEADGAFAAGLDTDWPDAGGLAVGVGARVLLVGEEELLLGECHQFELRA
jgi:type VI secretion system protein ImpE